MLVDVGAMRAEAWLESALSPAALMAELKKQLPLYMVPQRIVVRPTLPRSPNGKFDRNLIKTEFLSS